MQIAPKVVIFSVRGSVFGTAHSIMSHSQGQVKSPLQESVCVCVCGCVCMYIYICVYVCFSLCMHVYTNVWQMLLLTKAGLLC
jgi:hypothetical protein